LEEILVVAVRDISHLDPSAGLSMFTWDYSAADQHHRELGVEVGGAERLFLVAPP